MSDPRIIVALDYPDATDALALAGRLDPALCRVKVGAELYTAVGPALIEKLRRAGFSVFLDLKFHDIPNTVAAACLAAAELGVWMIDVHALGGRAMMEAARAALPESGNRPRLVAVTLLTSMDANDVAGVGLGASPQAAVLKLAQLAQASGLDGVVCSAREAAALRRQCGKNFTLVTPGIRPAGAGEDDQSRIATPREAIAGGADYLVIGRPIARAPDPLAALRAINAEIAG
ncbi:MAG TPA: orotidine-5'-phosphate decarboxylase [Burkholderiales bacterium]